jgi:hypothetical protein
VSFHPKEHSQVVNVAGFFIENFHLREENPREKEFTFVTSDVTHVSVIFSF